MSQHDVIRAWKDEEYRRGLSADTLAALPENPAGAVELDDDDLDSAGGNAGALTPIDPFGSLFNCSYDFYGCGTGCIVPCGNTWGGRICPF